MTTTDNLNADIFESENEYEFYLKMYQGQEDLAEALARLQKNPDFQKVFETAFFDNNLKQQVLRLGQVTDARNQVAIERVLFAIGYCKDWMNSVMVLGEQAKVSREEMIRQALAEQEKSQEEELSDLSEDSNDLV